MDFLLLLTIYDIVNTEGGIHTQHEKVQRKKQLPEEEALSLSRQFGAQLGLQPDHGLRMQLANPRLGHVQ